MRGVAINNRWTRYLRPVVLTIGLAGSALTSAPAAEPSYEVDGSTVEVSIPRSARRAPTTRSTSTARPRQTEATSSSVSRNRFEPMDEMVVSHAAPKRSVATRQPSPANARRVAAYEPMMRSSNATRYPNTRTAMHSASNRMISQPEEIAPSAAMHQGAMDGEVIYDDYSGPGSMPHEVFDGGYGAGAPPAWHGGTPYMPDVWHNKTWGITAGAEALFLRPHYSQGMGLQSITGTQPGETAVVNINGINWDNNYVGAFRGYLGLRNLVCGDEIRVTYWNFGDTQNLSAVADLTTNYCDFLCNQTANPGDTINTSLNLSLNVIDLDLIRAFCLPQPCMPTCNTCDSCDDSCGSCDSCGPCCPIWDVRWFAGLRFAQINHTLASTINTADGLTAVDANSTAKFSGVGPRIGLQMRRYFDRAARFSIYGRGAGSLLVGNLDQTISNFNVTDPSTLVTQTDSFNRIIPVAEIEIGATWCVTQRISVSGGWLAWAWWDLGLQERVTDFDTANILGFDGFFVRGEIVF